MSAVRFVAVEPAPARGEGPPAPAVPAPLVVDLDGTLTPTDTLAESLLRLARSSPLALLPVAFSLLRGRAAFKEAVAARVTLPVAQLPYRAELLEYLREQRALGRRIFLATAAHVSIARAVAGHLALFDAVLATEGARNLKGAVKLAACREHFGPEFVYAGDSRADLPLWRAAQAAVPVAVSGHVARALARGDSRAPGAPGASRVPIERAFPERRVGLADWLRAFRVHHWLKNLLLFVPLLTAFAFAYAAALRSVLAAFVAFSLVASGTYVVNDLWDLDSDRAHPRKRQRPLAAGRIGIVSGVVAAAVTIALGFALAALLPRGFVAMLLLYVAMTLAYSAVLKRQAIVDVIVLSLLYALRVLAGAVAAGVSVSSWLLAFSAFVFLSLALTKRCSELIALARLGQAAAAGRAYRQDDLAVLLPMGVAASLAAVVVFGLFISAPETQGRYASPQMLWLVACALTYWLGRLWLLTARGLMHDDPLVFAVGDRVSLATLLVMLAVMLGAHYVDAGTLVRGP